MATGKRSWMRRNRSTVILGIIIALFLFANYWSWPYVISGPGSAEPVHPRVETGYTLEEKGELLFTTVSTYSKPNLFSLIYAKFNPRMDIQTEQQATGGMTNMTAYRNLLSWMRDSSENYALLAAYTALDKPIEVEQQGVIVRYFSPGSLASANGLQEGDIIKHVDELEVLSVQELSTYLSKKKAGDIVEVTGTRGDAPFKASVPLIDMDQKGRIGIGFISDLVLKVTPPDPVKFDFNDVGGPSAGLMMTLEIVAQLSGEDLTRGYRIAGTGTIDADGTVGQIGGINYKLMAADKEKADYFLVPYDETSLDNWRLAEETVKKLNLDLKLVPVKNLTEAVDFLKKLESKA
ncbi:MAG: PDZ domain-containing protein [Candidatus Cohnella colombiensis]|uniref:endopeptidase La n=1 Tax=Candidatus Cohnella colombiensis TaxID=3121368 RepID=A0AA95JB54_9BACL|nr:MAG: PDZ domain-containing protein [Cohnella sp.]